MTQVTVVAIDGPAASGKSTLAKLLAERHGWLHINSGQMYRAVAYYGLQANLSLPNDEFAAIVLARGLIFSVHNKALLINGEDISTLVSLPAVEKVVSAYAAIADIRSILVNKQRNLANKHSVVMDGRDIGTVVFPMATLKIFLIASAEVRAMRRFNEIQLRYPDEPNTYENILKEIRTRDNFDSKRPASPLKQASDAILIDTSTLSISETVEKIDQLLKGRHP